MAWLPVLGSFNEHTHTQVLMNAIAHGGCTDTIRLRESAPEADSGREKNPWPHRGIEPASVLCLMAFRSDALTAELSRPISDFS